MIIFISRLKIIQQPADCMRRGGNARHNLQKASALAIMQHISVMWHLPTRSQIVRLLFIIR